MVTAISFDWLKRGCRRVDALRPVIEITNPLNSVQYFEQKLCGGCHRGVRKGDGGVARRQSTGEHDDGEHDDGERRGERRGAGGDAVVVPVDAVMRRRMRRRRY
ncbi:hypothetical protein [Arthrobacter woluwensis]|uniref:hypothetical protein n=1 Tax=Arthrobacter woluwensis TaxID=156980 RepID=UPI0011B29693|nr:hypothetical protein [Arthrobacter woluwensis]